MFDQPEGKALRAAAERGLEQQGYAAGMLVKIGAKPENAVVLSGRLELSSSGSLVLRVPNALVRGLFAACHEPGVELPLSNQGQLDAGVVVMTSDEVDKVGPSRLNERGKRYGFRLGQLVKDRARSWKEFSVVYAMILISPGLRQLRVSYGLEPFPLGAEAFHLTFAARRPQVLRAGPAAKGAQDDGSSKTRSHSENMLDVQEAASLGLLQQMPCPAGRVATPLQGLFEGLPDTEQGENCGEISPALRREIQKNGTTPQSRAIEISGVQILLPYDRSVLPTGFASVQELRRSGDHGLRSLAGGRPEFPGGYRTEAAKHDIGSDRCQRELRTGELSMGGPQGTTEKSAQQPNPGSSRGMFDTGRVVRTHGLVEFYDQRSAKVGLVSRSGSHTSSVVRTKAGGSTQNRIGVIVDGCDAEWRSEHPGEYCPHCFAVHERDPYTAKCNRCGKVHGESSRKAASDENAPSYPQGVQPAATGMLNAGKAVWNSLPSISSLFGRTSRPSSPTATIVRPPVLGPATMSKAGDFAEGIPSRDDYGDPTRLPKGLVDWYVQLHAARRAGLHKDIRIGTPETGLLSWATKKDLPGAGDRKAKAWYQTPIHSHRYGRFQGILCLPGSALITTDRGLLPIEEVAAKCDQIFVLGVGSRGLAFYPVSRAYRKAGHRRWVRLDLDTAHGEKRSLLCGAEHGVYVLGQGFVPAKNVVSGHSVVLEDSRKSAFELEVTSRAQHYHKAGMVRGRDDSGYEMVTVEASRDPASAATLIPPPDYFSGGVPTSAVVRKVLMSGAQYPPSDDVHTTDGRDVESLESTLHGFAVDSESFTDLRHRHPFAVIEPDKFISIVERGDCGSSTTGSGCLFPAGEILLQLEAVGRLAQHGDQPLNCTVLADPISLSELGHGCSVLESGYELVGAHVFPPGDVAVFSFWPGGFAVRTRDAEQFSVSLVSDSFAQAFADAAFVHAVRISEFLHLPPRSELRDDVVSRDILAGVAGSHVAPPVSLIKAKVIGATVVHRNDMAFDLEIEDAHNYFADGVLVHNSGYGAGRVTRDDLGEALVTDTGPDKLEFTLAHRKQPSRFQLIRPEGLGPRTWLARNTTPTEPLKEEKVRYKSVPPGEAAAAIDALPEGSVAQPKVDGASALIELTRRGPEMYSYRADSETGRPIIRTEAVFHGRPRRAYPDNLIGSILRGELYGAQRTEADRGGVKGRDPGRGRNAPGLEGAHPQERSADETRGDAATTGAGAGGLHGVGRPGVEGGGDQGNGRGGGEAVFPRPGERVIHPQHLGAILNSTLANSLRKQQREGIDLRALLFDLQRHGDKPVDLHTTPYAERRKLLEGILPHLPQGKFHLAPQVEGKDAIRRLHSDVTQHRVPLTHEGIVIHPPTGKPLKLKATEEFDTVITGTYPGEGRRLSTIGGLTYAHPDRPDVTVGRVGTGFSDDTLSQIAADPKAFIGRVMRLKAQERLPSGALRAPALLAIHEDLPQAKTASNTHTSSDGTSYNIDGLMELIKDRPVERLPLSDLRLSRDSRTGFSRKRYAEANTTYPGIVDPEGGLLDGRHRALKLRDAGETHGQFRRATDEDMAAVKMAGLWDAAANAVRRMASVPSTTGFFGRAGAGLASRAGQTLKSTGNLAFRTRYPFLDRSIDDVLAIRNHRALGLSGLPAGVAPRAFDRTRALAGTALRYGPTAGTASVAAAGTYHKAMNVVPNRTAGALKAEFGLDDQTTEDIANRARTELPRMYPDILAGAAGYGSDQSAIGKIHYDAARDYLSKAVLQDIPAVREKRPVLMGAVDLLRSATPFGAALSAGLRSIPKGEQPDFGAYVRDAMAKHKDEILANPAAQLDSPYADMWRRIMFPIAQGGGQALPAVVNHPQVQQALQEHVAPRIEQSVSDLVHDTARSAILPAPPATAAPAATTEAAPDPWAASRQLLTDAGRRGVQSGIDASRYDPEIRARVRNAGLIGGAGLLAGGLGTAGLIAATRPKRKRREDEEQEA